MKRGSFCPERDYGVSLLNDCKYGHDVKENRMRITLLKSATSPDYKQDQGEHYFTYSLLPHKGDFIEGETAREAYALNQPAKVVPGKWKNSDTSFISFSTDKVELDAVKRSEDGKYLVVRFHEYAGSRQKVKVYPGFAHASFYIKIRIVRCNRQAAFMSACKIRTNCEFLQNVLQKTCCVI